MPTITIDGLKVIYSNSSAAADVTLANATGGPLTEDYVSSPTNIAIDVLTLSGAGANTTVYSVDDGQANKPPPAGFTASPAFDNYDTDLLYQDTPVATWALGGDTSAKGAHVWIGTDNKVHYDASTSATIQALGAGQQDTDTLLYTIRMSNGTLAVGHITVNITGSNDAPTAISLSHNTVTENATGAVIGTLSTTDPDSGDSFTYAVNDSRFEVVNGALKLKAGVALDFETTPTVNLTVTSTDAGGCRRIRRSLLRSTTRTTTRRWSPRRRRSRSTRTARSARR